MIYSRRNVDFCAFRHSKHVILGMNDDNSLKTRVIPSKLVSVDSIGWILQAEHKNMSGSLKNNDFFSKKRRFSCISQTEQDILVTIDDLFDNRSYSFKTSLKR